MRILGINSIVNFQRRPTRQEEPEIKAVINDAYELIAAKERSVITHGSCFPAYLRDTNIGSPYGKAAREYIKFLSLYGFNSIQLGPNGLLEKGVNSPYKASAFAQNRMFIDLRELTGDKYGWILSKETYKDVTSIPEKSDKNYTMTDFAKAKETYDTALKEAYKNFRINLKASQPEAIALNKEYNEFLKHNDERLTQEGVFRILSDKYGTDDYTTWEEKRDATLITDINRGDFDAEIRFNDIYTNNAKSIEQYKFEQFLVVKQIKDHKQWRDERGFKYINDLLVGCSKMDAWRYEDAFLDDWEMGAYEGKGVSQRWHIPVINPKKIFLNDKYELNIGGKFLKEKIDYALEFCENVRVDHVMGLVEPYLMAKHAKDEDFVSIPVHKKNKDVEKYISELKDKNGEEYDKYWDYPKLIEKLVLPVFKAHGLDKNTAVWEDICAWPSRFTQVYNEQQLPKITNLDWTRVDGVIKYEPNNWFMLGNHDNMPVMNYLDRDGKREDGSVVKYTRTQDSWDANYLANYLNQDDSRQNIHEIRKNLEELYEDDDKSIVFAKFAELLTTPKFQISFDDLLGITDVIYNVPGESDNPNWQARITSDYLDKYYENLSSDSPTALNIPELLHNALQTKVDMEIKAHGYDENFRQKIYEKAQPVLDRLQHFAEVLKEN